MNTTIVHLKKGSRSNWSQSFCHVPPNLERNFPDDVCISEDLSVAVALDGRKLKIPKRHFGHVLQRLVLGQPTAGTGFLPDECTIRVGFERFLLGYSSPGNDSVGWYLSKIPNPIVRLWRRHVFKFWK